MRGKYGGKITLRALTDGFEPCQDRRQSSVGSLRFFLPGPRVQFIGSGPCTSRVLYAEDGQELSKLASYSWVTESDVRIGPTSVQLANVTKLVANSTA